MCAQDLHSLTLPQADAAVPSQGREYDFFAVDNDQCQDLSSPSPKPFAADHGVPEDGSLVVKVYSGPRCTVSTSEYCSEYLKCFVKGEAVCIVGKLRVSQLDEKENQEIGALLSTVRNWRNPKKVNATCLDKTRRHYLKHQYVTVWANGKYFTIKDIMRATHLDGNGPLSELIPSHEELQSFSLEKRSAAVADLAVARMRREFKARHLETPLPEVLRELASIHGLYVISGEKSALLLSCAENQDECAEAFHIILSDLEFVFDSPSWISLDFDQDGKVRTLEVLVFGDYVITDNVMTTVLEVFLRWSESIEKALLIQQAVIHTLQSVEIMVTDNQVRVEMKAYEYSGNNEASRIKEDCLKLFLQPQSEVERGHYKLMRITE